MGDDWSDKKLNIKKAKAHTIGGLPVGMKFDPMQGKKLQNFFNKVSIEAIRVLKPGGFMVSFSQPRLFHRMAIAAEEAGFEVRDMLVWEHNGGQGKAFTQNHFVKKMATSENKKNEIIKKLQNRKTPQIRPKFEAILLAQKPKDGTFIENWLKWKTGLIKIDFELEPQQSTVFNYSKPVKHEDFEHMTVKPLDLMERLIDVFTTEGQTVLDPFLGSGTTGIASIKKGRKFIGFEIEKKYVDMSIKRLKEYAKIN
jgi:site-specific DNA-methyltransferase (adenine-specific)